jgi:high affinity sulfate transporter 1
MASEDTGSRPPEAAGGPPVAAEAMTPGLAEKATPPTPTDGTVPAPQSSEGADGGTPAPPVATKPRPATLDRVASLVPGVRTIRTYRRAWLRDDLAAGIVLTALLVPQGMAYAELAGLPPVIGLYATMVPLFVYALFGPSRILVLGPDSAIVPVIAATIIPLAGADTAERVPLAGALAVLVGLVCLVAGLARFGFLADLLSKPVRTGYLAGIAVVITISQLPALLGIEGGGEKPLTGLRDLALSIGEANPVAGAIGVGSLAVILVIRRLARRVPASLVAVVGAILAVVVFGLEDQLPTVGPLPSGLPTPAIPRLGPDTLATLGTSAIAIAVLAFADTGVLSRSYAGRLGLRVDANRELAALGAVNLVTGFLQGFPVSASASRTAAAEAAGARTQLTGMTAAVSLGAILVFATGLFADLPLATLAAVVIAAVLGLVDVPALARLWRVNRIDFALAASAFGGVLLVGVIEGIGIAIGLSVLVLLWRAWHPYDAILGRITGRKGYHDTDRHPDARQVPGLLLYRFDAPLFFANADVFRARLVRAVQDADPQVRRVVVAAEPMTDVDSTGADLLAELLDQLDGMDVQFGFAELKGPTKDDLIRYGLYERIGAARFYSTIGQAVSAYVADFGIHWVDWEDEVRP